MRFIRFFTAAMSVVLVCAVEQAQGQDREHDNKTVLFGTLHAHSQLSKDLNAYWKARTRPKKGFDYTREKGLDFLAITDHHKAPDSGHSLRIDGDDYKEKLYDVPMDYNAAHPGEFIAIPGIEWGTTRRGNHVNLFGANSLPPDTILDRDYKKIFTWASTNCEFVQFNHPHSWHWQGSRDTTVGNFGENLYSNTMQYRQAVDPVAKTISIICSVQGGHISGKYRARRDKTHRDVHRDHYKEYLKYLNKGFHLSPAGNQDTHRWNWGTVTAARTAVWSESFTYNNLMKAFRENRVYATEDDEMVVAFQVRYNGRTYWMGETVDLDDEEEPVEVLVKVWQLPGVDGDPTNEGPYTVAVCSDYDGVGNRQAAEWSVTEDIPSGQLTPIPLSVIKGEYIFLEITEQGGKDNPKGDGADIYNNETGILGRDKKRDDMNDSAWTTPIWFK